MIRNYISLTKPRLMPLLSLTAVCSAIVAFEGFNWPILGALLVAGILSSGGSSSINCYLERDLDKKMPRTNGRPLVSGAISPPVKAVYFGSFLIFLSAVVSVIFINTVSTFFILLGAFFYIFVYTIWLKYSHRVLNIVIGGLAGSCASLAGWASAGSMSLMGWILALILFLWTPSHFWSLAIKLRDDYKEVGLPMMPSESVSTTTKVIFVNSLVLFVSTILPFYFGLLGRVYVYAAVSLGIFFLFLNLRLVQNNDDKIAFFNFKFSVVYMSLLLLGMVIDSVFF